MKAVLSSIVVHGLLAYPSLASSQMSLYDFKKYANKGENSVSCTEAPVSQAQARES